MSFTPVPISGLPDIGVNQLSSAKVAIEQNAVTFKAPVRPNPPNQINVQSVDQLEAELGVNLEIADNENITIVLDADFTLTKPIKLGSESGLEIRSSRVGIALTYAGAGAMIQLVTPGVPAEFLFAENLAIAGDGTNSFVDVEISAFGFIQMIGVSLSNFGSIGTLDSPATSLSRFSGFGIKEGLVFINPTQLLVDTVSFGNFAADNTTWFSIISDVASFVVFNGIIASNSTGAGDSLVFFDPNAIAGTLFIVVTSAITDNVGPGIFYQQGTDIAINSVADNGSGDARFTSAAVHGLEVGTPVVLSAFAGQATYNGTFIVTAIPTTTTFDVEEITFVATDTGNMNKSSLDSTDTLVLARGNLDSPDSRFTGDTGLEIFGAEVTSSSLAQDAFEVVTSASWASDNLERFSEGVVNTGQLVCNDAKVRSYNVSYSGTLEKSGGGAVDIGIIILKNGTNVAFNAPHTVNTGKIQISGVDIVELTGTDTIDIAVINYDGTATAIDISQLSLVVSKA